MELKFTPDCACKRPSETCMELTSAECIVENFLMMGREDARNMYISITEWIWIISASDWLFKKKSITMHSNMNVNLVHIYTTYKQYNKLQRIYRQSKEKKVKESRIRPGVAQRVPGGCHPHVLAAFTPSKCSWYSLSLEAKSTPRPLYGRKEICHWKIQWRPRESIPGPYD
jgi:hypothetical protein